MLLRFRIFDYLALVVSLTAVGTLASYAYQGRAGGTHVVIQGQGGEWIYPLDQDREVTIGGPAGDTVVAIHQGNARVVEASCRDKVCVSMGAISTPGAWVACLPNRLFIRVLGSDTQIDATAFSRRDLLAFFGALCLLLSTLEYLIPKPIPFMRVGLANLPILLAIGTFDARTVLLLVALKVLGQGLVSGTLFSYVFVFSAAGSFVAGITMLLAARAGGRRITLVGVSILGALASNLAQVFLAVALVFGQGGWLIGPPFLALGTASGLLLGLFAQAFEASSSWLREARGGAPTQGGRPGPSTPPPRPRKRRRNLIGELLPPRAVFLVGLLALPAFLFSVHPAIRLGQLVLFVLLSLLSGRRFRPLFALVATLGIMAANLLMPSGRVLWSAGALSVTTGALETGLRKSLTFVGLVYLSLFAVRPGLPLPGRFGGLLARMVYYFERLLESERNLDRRDLGGSLDRYLWSVSSSLDGGPELAADPALRRRRTGAAGWTLAAGALLLPWIGLAADLLLR